MYFFSISFCNCSIKHLILLFYREGSFLELVRLKLVEFFSAGTSIHHQSMKRFQLLRHLRAYRFMNGFKRVQDGSFLILSFRKRFSGSFRPASYRLFSMTVAHFNKYSDWSREDLIKKIRELERYGT